MPNLQLICKKCRTEHAPQAQPVEQERTQRAEENSDPQTHTRTQQTERDSRKNSFISMVVGATNDRLPIDAHWDGRWNT